LGNAPAAVPISNTRNIGHGSLEEKPPQGQLGGAQPITFSSQTEFPQSSNGTALQSAGIDASQMVDAADNLEISKNADRVEDLPTDISAGKTQDMAEVAFESMAFGEYGADQNESHNAPIPGIAPQNRPENSLQSSGAIPTTAAENPQEGLSAFILPSVVRAGNSGSFMKAASEPVATAQPQSFILQMAQRIQFQIREGKETIRIQLKPDSLGRVEIRAETTGNGVIARIATESNSVRSYLENNMHVLQQTLQDQGLKVDRIYFVVQDGLSFSANTGYSAQFGHAGTGHPGGESHSSHGMSGSLTSDLAEEKPLDATTWVSLNPNIRFHTIA
jgi:flagellar hook-length control protein FliK